MKIDHGLVAPSSIGTTAQYLKSLLLWPLLFPALKWYPDLAVGLPGYFLVLLNSSCWILGFRWLWHRARTADDDPEK